MITKIVWTKSTVSENWFTEKFGNLLSDTYQGNVHPNSDGGWSGWLINLSRVGGSRFRLDFNTKKGAVRWVNKLLRDL